MHKKSEQNNLKKQREHHLTDYIVYSYTGFTIFGSITKI